MKIWTYYLSKKKMFLLLLSPPEQENRRFFISAPALMQNFRFIFGIQIVLGDLGLPVGTCLEVGPFFVIIRRVTYPKEDS